MAAAQCIEHWKVVSECPTYEVSDHGRIRSLPHVRWISHAKTSTHPLRIRGAMIRGAVRRGPTGNVIAVMVGLSDGPRRVTRRLHRLVLEAFVGPCPPNCEACHNDGNALNNRLENLRWDTHRANAHDARCHGTASPPPHSYGEAHHHAVLSDTIVAQIRAIPYRRGLFAQLARDYHTTDVTIGRLWHGWSRA